MKKETGDPTCPPNVRIAKHIYWENVGRATAATVGDSTDDHKVEVHGCGASGSEDGGKRGGSAAVGKKR